ncbi:hypothetical protein OG795_18535 [[Kitasatospora] papulosa]|uniref:hypothetical protein n=1 Tax=[Kitasatospora] papulosa TaxID=1464011 RepID=UPI00324348CD
MSSETLFQRLDTEERDVREKLERLRGEIVGHEERLAHLAITRRTAVQLLGEPAAEEPTGQEDEPKTHEPTGEASESAQAAPADEDFFPPPGPRPTPGKGESTASGSHASQARLGPVSKKILLLVSSSDRPLRARDVAIALGHKDPKRTQVEGARTALQKLVDQGHLTKIEQGLFAGATSSAKGAA